MVIGCVNGVLSLSPACVCTVTVLRVSQSQVGQNFTFVLTDIESKQRFGFCRLTSGCRVCICLLRYDTYHLKISTFQQGSLFSTYWPIDQSVTQIKYCFLEMNFVTIIQRMKKDMFIFVSYS